MQEKQENKVTSEEKTAESSEPVKEETEKLIRKHVYASLGMGVVPIPFVDFAGVSLIQLNLLRKLAQVYNVPFSKDMVKNLIAALIGGAAPASFSRYLFSMMKALPAVGTVAGIAGASVVGGASTYAIGKVFSRHFAEGGTFLTFDPEKAKAFYAEMFEEGKGVASDIKSREQTN
ncbi:MAG: DUF697 domain-containing protein [Desulfobacterales bacterium]|nr:DUF697 domain-containing protein [Desulfobacterales bacterium]